MAVYEDATFTAVVGPEYSVEVPNHIFIGLALVEAGHYILQAKECWVTPDASPDHSVRYDVLENGCANNQVFIHNESFNFFIY